MEKLKRFTDFDSLKLASKPTQKAALAESQKLKEQREFFDLLRANLVVKGHRRKFEVVENRLITGLVRVCKVLEDYSV